MDSGQGPVNSDEAKIGINVGVRHWTIIIKFTSAYDMELGVLGKLIHLVKVVLREQNVA